MFDYLDTHAERDGEGHHDQEVGQEGQDESTAVRGVRGSWRDGTSYYSPVKISDLLLSQRFFMN